MACLLLVNISASAAGYDYPVKPGMPEWEEATQDRGQLKADLQIPEDLLSSMSTEELVDTVLNYPCFNDLYYYNNKQEGFESLSDVFNGFQELLSRDDAATVLLNKYNQTAAEQKNVKSVMSMGDAEAVEKISYKANIEVLLAQPEVYEDMIQEEAQEIDNIIDNEQKSVRSLASTITYKQNMMAEMLNDQQNNEVTAEVSEISEVSPMASIPTATVKTPKGSSVAVLILGEQLTASDKQYMKVEALQSFPGTSFVQPATSHYNCHSYAWYSQSYGSNRFWMNDPTKYMTDGSYKEVSLGSRKNADRVWYSGTHTALVNKAGQSNDQISKWGDYPLMQHGLKNNPYYYAPLIIKAYRR